MSKYFFYIVCSFTLIFSSCSSKQDSKSTQECSEQTSSTNQYSTQYSTPAYSSNPTPDAPVSTTSSGNNTTRSDAFQMAFNCGKSAGYSDALNGVNDSYSGASVYSDDWLQQAYIQGYELGQSEAESHSSSNVIEYDEPDYEGGYY